MNYKILIVSISISILAIIAACLWVGIAMREVTVVEHPYQDGLKYDATRKKYADLGWKVVVPASLSKDGQLNVMVYDRNGAPLDAESVDFAISRVASTETTNYRAARADSGGYGARVNCALKGYWDVRVKVTRGADSLSYDSRMHVNGK